MLHCADWTAQTIWRQVTWSTMAHYGCPMMPMHECQTASPPPLIRDIPLITTSGFHLHGASITLEWMAAETQ